jgi:UDP-N-acetylglucosamine/UDP-N-acetylgalactosamine diphosphorylase
VKYLHVFSVDNAVCRPADPRFVGYFAARGADCGNKCVWKVSPEERVGVMAKRDGKPCVVEYTEIDEERMKLRDASGRLVYGAGNICNHLFSVAFLAEVVIPGLHTLFHLAHKKIPYADDTGVTVQPSSNNGLKLEAFIFDTFPMSSKMAILETLREDEFSPVKNAPGAATDSPDTARAIMAAQAKRWVAAAGGTVSGDDDAMLEISPLLSWAGEGLEERVRGQTITVPCYLDASQT